MLQADTLGQQSAAFLLDSWLQALQQNPETSFVI
jgi:hypothetical protein